MSGKERWITLRDFKCPVKGCSGQANSYDWVCVNDKTPVLISQKGNMRCSASDKGSWRHFGLICNWRFDCGNHGDHPFTRFQHADMQGFTFALSYAVQLMTEAGATWVGALCEELGKQYQ